MKSVVLNALIAVVGVVLAAPQNVQNAWNVQNAQNVQPVQLLQYDSYNDGLGNYNFVYEQSDGQSRNEDGELRNAGAEDAFVAVKGSYSWTAPNGANFTVSYIADENGYQPVIRSRMGLPTAVVASLLG